MALNASDPRPTSLSVRERYRRLRAWYQANTPTVAAGNDNRAGAARRSADYVRSLPPPESASPAEIEAVFHEVQTRRLEWAYHDSDGHYKMAAYAGA